MDIDLNHLCAKIYSYTRYTEFIEFYEKLINRILNIAMSSYALVLQSIWNKIENEVKSSKNLKIKIIIH